jgi:hypothetical protein
MSIPRIHSEKIAAFAAEPTITGLCPYIRAEGIGTASEPLRIACLLRHADMADESTLDEAYSQAMEVGNSLYERLLTIRTLNGLDDIQIMSQLEAALTSANEDAVKTGTYYSVAAGLVAGGRLVAVGLGHVKIWLLHDGEFSVLLEPTVMPVSEQRPDNVVLTAALGKGFSAKKISRCNVQLAPDHYAVLGMRTDLTADPNSNGVVRAKTSSLADLLTEIERQMRPKPPLTAIVRC